MPIQQHHDDKGCYARWGDAGAKYYYKCDSALSRLRARKKALAQGIAIGDIKFENLNTINDKRKGTHDQELND